MSPSMTLAGLAVCLLIDGLSRPGMVHINQFKPWDDGHGFLVSRPLARPVLERMHIGHRDTVHRTTWLRDYTRSHLVGG